MWLYLVEVLDTFDYVRPTLHFKNCYIFIVNIYAEHNVLFELNIIGLYLNQ